MMEDEFDVVVYWWVGSHLERKGMEGSYSINGVADMLCDEVLKDPEKRRKYDQGGE